MSKPKQNIISKIKGFDTSIDRPLDELIAFAKRSAKLANNRLYRLKKAGIASRATTGGVAHISLKSIKSKATAIRAISKARSLISNPLSTPGSVNKLYRQAVKEYGKSGRMKFIAVEEKVYDEHGNWTGKVKLVPKAVPVGTNKGALSWNKAKQALKDFWTWYETIGSNYLDSDEAYSIWIESGYDARKAVDIGEEHIYNRGQEIAQDYEDTKSVLFGESDWLK